MWSAAVLLPAFPGRRSAASGAVVEERPEQMVAVAPLKRRPGVLLVAVRGHQRRVDIHDQRRLRVRLVIRRVLSGVLPDPGAGRRPPAVDAARARGA